MRHSSFRRCWNFCLFSEIAGPAWRPSKLASLSISWEPDSWGPLLVSSKLNWLHGVILPELEAETNWGCTNKRKKRNFTQEKRTNKCESGLGEMFVIYLHTSWLKFSMHCFLYLCIKHINSPFEWFRFSIITILFFALIYDWYLTLESLFNRCLFLFLNNGCLNRLLTSTGRLHTQVHLLSRNASLHRHSFILSLENVLGKIFLP